jgi:hypothetical protein
VAGLVVELVLELDAEQVRGPAVERGAELAEPFGDQGEVAGVVGAVPHAGLLHPVGEAAVAGLAVAPGADPQHHVETLGHAQVDEGGDVEVAAELRLAAPLDVVQPEDVGGDDGDPAGPHQPQPLGPPVPGHPAVVDLAGDRDHRGPVAGQMTAGQRQPRPRVLGVAHPRQAHRLGPRTMRDEERFGRHSISSGCNRSQALAPHDTGV